MQRQESSSESECVPLSPRSPQIPVVALDDVAGHISTPFEAALSTVAEGCAYAPLVRHFAREGEEQDLLRASVRVGAAQHPYVLHMLDESCVALVHMACARDPAEGSGAGVSGAELAALEAALEERVQPERLAAWRRLQAALANDLRRYAQERGQPVLRIFFLAVAPGRTRSALLGRMLAHLGRMADTEGRYTWLDTVFLPDEDAVLEAQGFLRLRRLKVEGGGPALSVLVRPPHSREGGSK